MFLFVRVVLLKNIFSVTVALTFSNDKNILIVNGKS